MFKYDTLMGTYPGSVTLERAGVQQAHTGQNLEQQAGQQDFYLCVGNYRIKLIAQADPANINWGELGVEWVVESSGHFTKAQDARKHVSAGAQHVLITAPAKGEDIAIIPGVNQDLFDSKKHAIVSLGSCTTNALVPTLKVLHDAFGIASGFMTTTHAYTNTQVLLDVNTDDPRRSRAAALNIIPTTTGASDMVGKIIPELAGVVLATSIRVPVAKVSLIDLSVITQKPCSVESIHAAFESAARGPMRGILALTHEPLVSSDFSGDNHSVIIDGLLTAVHPSSGSDFSGSAPEYCPSPFAPPSPNELRRAGARVASLPVIPSDCKAIVSRERIEGSGSFVKIFGWYDNEWAYSVRLKDFLLTATR
jgi:glyceraldehyde-3-phosphate dehydrogenase type I